MSIKKIILSLKLEPNSALGDLYRLPLATLITCNFDVCRIFRFSLRNDIFPVVFALCVILHLNRMRLMKL
jgi:hypothetical protein